MSDEPEILEAKDDGVLWLTLNRPDKLNALSPRMKAELPELLRAAAADDDVKCVVLTGAGRGFCAGGERSQGGPDPAPPAIERLEARTAELRRAASTAMLLHDMGKPTIAMINGPCAGAGLSLAAACDIRIASEDAVLTSAFIRLGLPGDYGGAWFWTKILGTAKTRRLYMLSERFKGTAAQEFGLVDVLASAEELHPRTREIAATLAAGSPRAFRFLKETLNAAEDGERCAVVDLEARNMALADVAGQQLIST